MAVPLKTREGRSGFPRRTPAVTAAFSFLYPKDALWVNTHTHTYVRTYICVQV